MHLSLYNNKKFILMCKCATLRTKDCPGATEVRERASPQQHKKTCFFYKILLQISCFFCFLPLKTLKITISTSVWSAQHLNAGQNIQHTFLLFQQTCEMFWRGYKNIVHTVNIWILDTLDSVIGCPLQGKAWLLNDP